MIDKTSQLGVKFYQNLFIYTGSITFLFRTFYPKLVALPNTREMCGKASCDSTMSLDLHNNNSFPINDIIYFAIRFETKCLRRKSLREMIVSNRFYSTEYCFLAQNVFLKEKKNRTDIIG